MIRNALTRGVPMENHPIDLFSGTITTLSRSMDMRARNHEMILNNVANADTPKYKPFAVNVEQALQESSSTSQPATLRQTDDQHLPGTQSSPDDVKKYARTTADDALLIRGDKNGVNIDEEMAELAKNSLLYKASAQIISSKFKGLKKVLTEGK